MAAIQKNIHIVHQSCCWSAIRLSPPLVSPNFVVASSPPVCHCLHSWPRQLCVEENQAWSLEDSAHASPLCGGSCCLVTVASQRLLIGSGYLSPRCRGWCDRSFGGKKINSNAKKMQTTLSTVHTLQQLGFPLHFRAKLISTHFCAGSNRLSIKPCSIALNYK